MLDYIVLVVLSYICICILVYAALKHDYWQPDVLFSVPLVMQYLIYLVLYSQEYRLTDRTNIIVVIGYVGFIIGYRFYVESKRKLLLHSKMVYNKKLENILLYIAILFIFIEFVDVFQNKIYGIYGTNYLRNIRYNILYAENVSLAFSKYGPFILYALCLLEFGKVIDGDKNYKKLCILITFLYSTIIFTLARTAVLQYTLAFLYLYTCYIKSRGNSLRSNIKRSFMFILVLLLVIVVFNVIAVVLEKSGADSIWSREFYLYKYIGYPLITFDRFVLENPASTKGYFVFGPIGKILQIFGLYPNDILKKGFNISSEVFNAPSYLQAPYNDWGMIGIVIVPILLGMLSGYIYQKARCIGGYWRLFYANFIYSIVVSFFYYQFSLSSHIYLIILFCLLKGVLCRQKRNVSTT